MLRFKNKVMKTIMMISTKILQKLEENYGILYLSDKSEPEEIKQELQMSKKNFKRQLAVYIKTKS